MSEYILTCPEYIATHTVCKSQVFMIENASEDICILTEFYSEFICDVKKSLPNLLAGNLLFDLRESKCTHTLVSWSSFLPLGNFSLVAYMECVRKSGGRTLMHLTDYPDLPSTLLFEWMVMSVIGRKQRHSADHTVPFALVWHSLCFWNCSAQPPTLQLSDKTTR